MQRITHRSSKPVKLGDFEISENSLPYLIAEIGVNHENSIETAKKLIELAKEGGAQAAKFQTYKAETLASRNSPAYWDTSKEKTTSQFELFSKYDTFGEKEYGELAEYCHKVGIDFLSTPFDSAAVDFLDPWVPFFKIASADITNYPLLRKVASKGKPIVLSTGASRIGEADAALEVLKKAGAKEVILLHCVLNYPTHPKDAQLSTILNLRELFPENYIGYSDHTPPTESMSSLLNAYLMGSRVLEKHFTHDPSLPGNDHYHAATADDFKRFWVRVNDERELMGHYEKIPGRGEERSRIHARRSLVTLGPVKAGTPLSEANLIPKRPAHGISPKFVDEVLGAIVLRDLEDDHILKWDDISVVPTNPRVCAFVQARMGASRYPAKMLAPLAGKPVLEWVLSRLKKSKKLSEVVLLTSTRNEDQALRILAEKMGIPSFAGDEFDVLNRFFSANQIAKADYVVRVCADNPFIDPQVIDSLVEFHLKYRPDYSYNHRPTEKFPIADGFGAEMFSSEILNELQRSAQLPAQREHVTKYIWDHSYAFDVQTPKLPMEIGFPDCRFDVDTKEDLQRLEPMARKIGMNGTAQEFVRVARDSELS